MLKITQQIESDIIILVLEGRLTGPWVRELELSWRSADGTSQIHPMRVDLSSVSFIDAEGKALLTRMCREGAQLVTTGCLNKCIVEGIMRSEEKKV